MVLLQLLFPFKIDSKEIKSEHQASIEKKGTLVSFALPYELSIDLENAKCLKCTRSGREFIYVFEFTSTDSIESWTENPVARVGYSSLNGDCKKIEDEMNEFMANYEEKTRKRRRKALVDEEGYTYYE